MTHPMERTMQYEIMDRPQAARFLQTAYCLRVTKESLATMATRGGGPPMFKIGRYARYLKSDLIKWAARRCSGVLDSTSTPHNRNTGRLFDYAEDMGDLEDDTDDCRKTGDPRFDEMTR